MADFHIIPTYSFEDLLEKLKNYDDKHWIFRGQYCEWHLESSLERAIESSGLNLKEDGEKIEAEMIRSFRRYYDGEDRKIVAKDTLYCLSLLQHHGAPTRLLDWTYSWYVAVYNAIECAFNNAKKGELKRNCAVWYLDTDWCSSKAKESIITQKMKKPKMTEEKVKKEVKEFMENRGDDKKRIEHPEIFDKWHHIKNIKFRSLEGPYKFVLKENPFTLHNRLFVQQAVSLCPGDLSVPFEENLEALAGWEEHVGKITCSMSIDNFQKALKDLWKMNISRASLYPGLDGYVSSMKYNIGLFREIRGLREKAKQTL